MSDFKLSDKIRSWLDYKEKMIDVKDVKEFIKELEREINADDGFDILELIDKLAGEDLK